MRVTILPPNARAILDHVLQCSAVGTVDDIAVGLKGFQARTGVDEIIVANRMTSGGIVIDGQSVTLADIEAIRALVPMGVEGAIVGSALYKGAFTLPEALDVARGAPPR